VLVVEDDRSVRDMLSAVLGHEGHRVDAHDSAESALATIRTAPPDLVILDVGLPGMNGLRLCEQLRHGCYDGPVLMLTARHEVADRVKGLDAGADDYLVKPFALDELLARVRAMLRRTVRAGPSDGPTIAVGDLVLDLDTRDVRRAGAPVDLTKIEFDLLELLVANSPAVLTRDVIHERIWGYDAAHMSNSLEVFISQLRKKTEAGGGDRVICTVRSVGYAARVPRCASASD
jgi:two-component system response regulator MprA